MEQSLTESDMARIEQFANMPKHTRTPEMLVPAETGPAETGSVAGGAAADGERATLLRTVAGWASGE